MTRTEALNLGTTTDLPTLGRLLGISEPTVREMHRRGEIEAMEIRVLHLGTKWRVITADILRVLGVIPDAEVAAVRTASDAESGSAGMPDGDRTAARRG